MPKRIDKLTKKQEKEMPIYARKWIEIGLRTGETDWATFDKFMPICYEKAKLVYPKNVIRVQSPLVGALAASIAEGILRKKRGAVDDAVDDAVGDAVGDAVDGAVGGATNIAISIARKAGVSLSWHYWLGGQFWVGWSWGWGVSFSNFFFDICKLKLTKDIMDRANAYRKVCESVNYIWPNRDFVIVCARPAKINRNQRGQLHSDTEMAISYPDGWGLYLLNGVRFPEELWKKIVSRKMPFEEILKIVDVDQRTQAMRYGDVREFLKHTKSALLDSKEVHNTNYELWKTPKESGIFTIDAYHAIYSDPETKLIYMSGIAPEIGEKEDVLLAMGWKRKLTKE